MILGVVSIMSRVWCAVKKETNQRIQDTDDLLKAAIKFDG